MVAGALLRREGAAPVGARGRVRRRREAAPARAGRRRPRDPTRARRAGEVAGVVHAAADRVELPRDEDTHPGELIGHQLVHHRAMYVSTTDLTEIIMHAHCKLELTVLQINFVVVRIPEHVLLK